MKRIVFEVGSDLKKEFKLQCAKQGTSQKDVLINLVSKWVRGKGKRWIKK